MRINKILPDNMMKQILERANVVENETWVSGVYYCCGCFCFGREIRYYALWLMQGNEVMFERQQSLLRVLF